MYTAALASRAETLLMSLHDILTRQGENNWIRGVSAALAELAVHSEEGFDNAKSIYLTMVHGGRGFSDYFIWNDDEGIRIKSNEEIDRIRSELWDIFYVSQ